MKLTVIRYEGSTRVADVWHADTNPSIEIGPGGTLTIHVSPPTGPTIIACVYGPGHWLLVRSVEGTRTAS